LFVDVTVVVTVLVTTDVTATALTTGENRIDRITNATAVDNVIQIFMVSDQIVTGRTGTK
jgi:hypothetical protein